MLIYGLIKLKFSIRIDGCNAHVISSMTTTKFGYNALNNPQKKMKYGRKKKFTDHLVMWHKSATLLKW